MNDPDITPHGDRIGELEDRLIEAERTIDDYRDALTAMQRERDEARDRIAALADDWLAASSRYAHMAEDAPTDGLQSLYAGRADTYGVCSSKLRLLALNPNGDRK